VVSWSLAAVALVHACLYFLLATAPFVLYHWRRRLFLGSMGIVALTAYASATIGGSFSGSLRVVLACGTIGICCPLLMLAATAPLRGRSPFAWAVLTYAGELFLLRLVAQDNPLTRGELGIASPLGSTSEHGFLGAIVAVGSWTALYVATRRRRWLWAAERVLESPRLAAVLGVSVRRAEIVPTLLAAVGLALATGVFLLWQPLIQPGTFALCSSLVAMTAAFLAPRPSVLTLFGFSIGIVTIRVAVGILGTASATQLAELIAGIGIVAVARYRRTP
jgi:hypothetical protein